MSKQLVWTKELPAASGWYWFCIRDVATHQIVEPRIVSVCMLGNKCIAGGKYIEDLILTKETEWAGPIEEPIEQPPPAIDVATGRRVEIVLLATYTESPSFNVRILCGGATTFYNSERLQGNVRLRAVGKVLGLTTMTVGQYNMTISQEQYNAITNIELTTALDDCYKADREAAANMVADMFKDQLDEPTKGYDPIATAEEEGSQAYKDGYDLKEAIEEYNVDIDTDDGMAFVQAFKETKEVTERL